jgi:hypothetical protein
MTSFSAQRPASDTTIAPSMSERVSSESARASSSSTNSV